MFFEDVDSVAFSPDGRRIASPCGRWQIGVWDSVTGKQLATFQGNEGDVSAIAFSGDGRQLLSVDERHGVKIWDAQGPASSMILEQTSVSPGWVETALSQDASTIATASEVGEIKVWDVGGRLIYSVRGPELSHGAYQISLSAHGDRLALSDNAPRTGEKWHSRIRIWDSHGKEIRTLKEEGALILAPTFSHDGARIGAVLTTKDLRDPRSTVKLWEVATGRQVSSIPSTRSIFPGLAFTSDGTRLAWIEELWPNLELVVWDTATGTESVRWPWPGFVPGSVAFSPDGKAVATTVIDRGNANDLLVCELASGKTRHLGQGWHSATYSPDGTRIAAFLRSPLEKPEIGLWDAGTGRQLLVLKGLIHNAATARLAFSPGGDRILAIAKYPSVWTFEVKTWDATPWKGKDEP
jgi:WD40 repeat protein